MKNFKSILLATLAIAILSACNKNSNCVSGSGSNVSRDYNTTPFYAVSVSGDAQIIITKDTVNDLRIEGQQNILDVLNVSVNNGVLTIGENNCTENANPLKIFITTPALIGLYTSGSCTVLSKDTFTANTFTTNMSGTGTMELNISAQEFYSSISGEGDIKVTGNAVDQSYKITGTGNYQCFEFLGENADVDISGEGLLEVNVSKTLIVDISGSGTVYYKGHPTKTINISGSGSVIDAN